MNNPLPNLLPVNILLTTYNRINFLKKTIEAINERTSYPFRLFVIDNASTDGTVDYLKNIKVLGKVYENLLLSENKGQSEALNRGFALMQSLEKIKSDDLFVTTNDDLLPPLLTPCWLETMRDLFLRYESSHEIGAIAMRIQRNARTEFDESLDLTRIYKGIPSVFRILKRSDFAQLGESPFRKLRYFDSNSTATVLKTQLKKRYYLATHVYANHIGFEVENKGYEEGNDYLTNPGPAKLQVYKEKPYPEINPETNVPIKIRSNYDAYEQCLRDEHVARLNGTLPKPEITAVVLTCHRYEGLKKIVESIRANTKDVLYDLLIVIDRNDIQAYNYCLEQGINCLLSNYHRDFVKQANLGVYACQTQYFTILGDDLEIMDKDWLSRGLGVFKAKFPDSVGVVAFNDGIQHGKVLVAGLSSKKFVHAVGGYWQYPGYAHYGGDRELTNLATAMGCYHYEDSIHLVHNHPGKHGEKDETYQLSENEFWQHDQKLKKYRQANVNLLESKNYYEF